MATRAVSGLSETSTMRTRPPRSTCDSCGERSRVLRMTFFARQEERQAFERHGQIDILELDVSRYLQRPGREVQNRAHACLYGRIHNALGRIGRNGDDGDVDVLAFHQLAKLSDVVDPHAASRPTANLRSLGVE